MRLVPDLTLILRLNQISFLTSQQSLLWAGTIPAEKYSILAGKKCIHDTLKNGLEVYMLYDGDILEATFTCRLFVWYGINIEDPSNCGVAIKY